MNIKTKDLAAGAKTTEIPTQLSRQRHLGIEITAEYC